MILTRPVGRFALRVFFCACRGVSGVVVWDLEGLAEEVVAVESGHTRTLDRVNDLSWSRLFEALDKTGSIPAWRLG